MTEDVTVESDNLIQAEAPVAEAPAPRVAEAVESSVPKSSNTVLIGGFEGERNSW